MKRNIFSALKHLKSKEFEEMFETELDKVLNASNNSEDAAQTVAQNYVRILKSIFPSAKGCRVVVNNADPYSISIDGQPYELDTLVQHNDLENTELLMEIQALWSEVDTKRVQMALDDLISQ